MEFIKMQYDRNGNIIPEPKSIEFVAMASRAIADEIQGDGNANGTLILSIQIQNTQTIYITDLQLYSKVAAATIYLVVSDTNGVGGSEQLLAVYDISNTSPLSKLETPISYSNLTGVDNYILIYAPQTRAGATTNNANTQYFSANIQYLIQS